MQLGTTCAHMLANKCTKAKYMLITCLAHVWNTLDTLAVGILYSSTVKEATHSYTQYLTVKVA